MLVLTRRIGERIFVGEGAARVTITLVRIGPTQARIGIDAPGELTIVREELTPAPRPAAALADTQPLPLPA